MKMNAEVFIDLLETELRKYNEEARVFLDPDEDEGIHIHIGGDVHDETPPSFEHNSEDDLVEYIRRWASILARGGEASPPRSILLIRRDSISVPDVEEDKACILLPVPDDNYELLLVGKVNGNTAEVHTALIGRYRNTVSFGYASMSIADDRITSDRDINSSRIPWMDNVSNIMDVYDTPLIAGDFNRNYTVPLPDGDTYSGKNIWFHSNLEEGAICLSGIWVPVRKSWAFKIPDTLPEELIEEIALYKNLSSDKEGA